MFSNVYKNRLKDALTKVNREKEEQLKVRKRLKIVFAIFFILLLVVFVRVYFSSTELKKNGVITSAIVTNVIYENYTVYEADSPNINHYYISYEFRTKVGNIQKKTSEVSQGDYKHYFQKKIKKGDAIRIRYLEDRPEKAEIVELDDL